MDFTVKKNICDGMIGAALAVLVCVFSLGAFGFAVAASSAGPSFVPRGGGIVTKALPREGGAAPQAVSPAAPYGLDLAVYAADEPARKALAVLLAGRGDAAGLLAPGSPLAFLALTLRPEAADVSLYASAGQTSGKPTEVGAVFDGGGGVASLVTGSKINISREAR